MEPRVGTTVSEKFEEIRDALTPHGLILRGGFVPTIEDGAPPRTRTLLLIGNAGAALWRAFVPHAEDGPEALNLWTVRVVEPLADRFGARPLYVFEGPPYWPFQRWAQRAEPVHSSPLGILIHPRWGLWHAYRAALAFERALASLPPHSGTPSPCPTCSGQPCLGACPVGAFTGDGYDVAACRGHLVTEAGRDCIDLGCRARRACPIGKPHAYGSTQAAFHMRAFVRSNSRAKEPPGRSASAKHQRPAVADGERLEAAAPSHTALTRA
jgi:hypothetical protein